MFSHGKHLSPSNDLSLHQKFKKLRQIIKLIQTEMIDTASLRFIDVYRQWRPAVLTESTPFFKQFDSLTGLGESQVECPESGDQDKTSEESTGNTIPKQHTGVCVCDRHQAQIDTDPPLLSSLLRDNNPIFKKDSQFAHQEREALIDNMGTLSLRFQMSDEAFELAVLYFDEYMSSKRTTPRDLDVITETCLYIASKFEDPRPFELFQICQLKYQPFDESQLQIKVMEGKILKKLNWKLVRTTHRQLLSYLVTEQDESLRSLALFLIDLAIIKGLNREFRKTVLVTASLDIAESILKKKLQTNKVRRQFKKMEMESDLDCFERLRALYYQKTQDYQSLKRKYKNAPFKKDSINFL